MKNTCRELEGLFEALSAWLDGQASVAEALRVEAHLEGCPACREVVEALRALQTAAPAVPMPEIPHGFAARTRRLVEARAGQAWDARLRRAGRRLAEWVDGLLPAAASLARGPLAGPSGFREPDPVAALLGTRGLRAGLASPSTWLLLALGLYGLPALVLALLGRADQAGFFLVATALGLLVALPAWHLRVDLSVLVSLKRGRCLEEILGTGLPPGSLVDSLAWTSLRNLVRVGLPVAGVLLAGTLVLPASWRAGAALAAVAWLPGVAVLLAVASYASQALVLFARGGERPGPATLAVVLAMGTPALGMLVASREAAAAAAGPEAAGSGLALAGALVASALWVGLAGRFAATWGLDHPSELERSNGAARPRRNRWVRAWNENPVVVRESTRASAAIPLGLPGLVLARFLAVGLPVLGTWSLLELTPESRTEAFWAGAAVLGWVAWLRAAGRASAALAQEREARTLETLVQSGLAREDFARGWLQVACAPLYLELAVTGAMVSLVALVIPEVVSGWAQGVSGTLDLGAAGLVIAALAAMPLAGAWSGLAVSASSATRREAGARAVGAWWRALGAWLVAWASTSAALMALVDLAGGELDGTVWNCLVGSVLPAGTLALTVLAQTWSARRAVEGHLAARWNDPSAELPVSPAARRSRRRVLILGPALAALVLVGLQAGLVLLVFRGTGPVATWTTLGGVASGLLVTAGLVLLAWRLLSPVLDALADVVGRSPLATGLVAGLFGAGIGVAAAQVPLVVGTLSGLGLLEDSRSPDGWGALLGFALTGGLAALGALAWPAGEEGWELDPLQRAWEEACRFGRPRALVGLGLLLAGTAVLGLQVHRVLTGAPEDPMAARALVEAAAARDRAAEALAPERNGFRLLEPALASRQWELQGVGLARRHRELAEAMRALSWAEVGSRDENLKTLRANPERARQGAARLDAALPVIREALDRPHFAVPSRLAEGPSAPVPNFLLMRALAQGLRVRALLHEEEGRLDQALEMHLLNLRWSDRLAGQGTLIFGMITVALNSIAEEGLLGFLERHRLDEEAYGRVLRVLDSGRVDAEAFLKSLDGEMAFGRAAFEALEAGRIEALGPEYRMLLLLPRSYWQRDRQLYLQTFLEARDRVARGQRGSNLLEGNPWWGSRLSLAGALVPNVTRAWFQVRLASSRHAANRLVCLVELHRLRTGPYPATLEELGAPGVSRDPLNGRTFDYQRVGNRFRLRTVAPELRRLGGPEERDGVRTWLPGAKS